MAVSTKTSQEKKKKQNTINFSSLSKKIRTQYRQIAYDFFKKGHSYKYVSSRLGLSVYTVREWHQLFRAGAFNPEIKLPGPTSQSRSTKEARELIRAEYKKGASVSSLSVKYGKCKTTIRYWINGKEQEG